MNREICLKCKNNLNLYYDSYFDDKTNVEEEMFVLSCKYYLNKTIFSSSLDKKLNKIIAEEILYNNIKKVEDLNCFDKIELSNKCKYYFEQLIAERKNG